MMRAMVLVKPGMRLEEQTLPIPVPNDKQVLIKVQACGICRTDLHVVDGELPHPHLPLIPGHQIVGTIVKCPSTIQHLKIGDRVGVPWLGESCQHCYFCLHQQENLCEQAEYTGYQIPGGFAEYTVANAQYCFKLPEQDDVVQVAPLLCAGLIGYRAYRHVENAKHLGLVGFGAAAHILIQIATKQGKQTYAFTRSGDLKSQAFAKELGATWAGDSTQSPPQLLDGIIIFAPDGDLVVHSLRSVRKGGIVVCAGIHMSDIPSFPYQDLWGEKTLLSIANLTREDGLEFLALAPTIPIRTHVTTYPLEKVNEALNDLRTGAFQGAGVILI